VDLTLLEALGIWISGRQLDDHTIHGFSIVWIGRMGKLLSFVSGFVIVLDIIGPDRIRAWFERLLGESDIELHVRAATAFRTVAIALAAVVAVSLSATGLYSVYETGWSEHVDALGELREERGSAFPLPGGMLLWLLIAGAVGFFAAKWGGPILKRISSILSHPKFALVARIAGFTLFLVGFAMDYLAS
jgi:hypothetical protein